MSQASANPLRGGLALLLYTLNTIFWTSLLFLVAIPKLAIPLPACQRALGRLSVALGNGWIWVNNQNLRLLNRVRWEIQGLEGLKQNAWYLLVANHQSWVDILVLQKAMLGQVPFLRFFIKKSLIWMPFLGQAWWVLDYPFLDRHSKQQLRQNPSLAKKDLKAINAACQKFKLLPTTVMIFAEGSRFTSAKQAQQESPHARLLRPKAGGIARTLKAMGGHLEAVLDVTVAYPQGVHGLWGFICRQRQTVRVQVESIALGSLPFMGEGRKAPAKPRCNNGWTAYGGTRTSGWPR